MSFDLAVWAGPAPADDVDGLRAYQLLFDRYLGDDAGEVAPVVQVQAFVAAVLARWPEPDRLRVEARGPFAYLSMSWQDGDEVTPEVAAMADDQGLNCFDPQSGLLRPAPRPIASGPPAWRMETSVGRTVPRPDRDRICGVLQSLPREGYVIIEDARAVASEQYAQAMLLPDGIYQVEYRAGSAARHYAARTASAERAADALAGWMGGWTGGGQDWRTTLDWERLDDA
jgi:hypothetical protein